MNREQRRAAKRSESARGRDAPPVPLFQTIFANALQCHQAGRRDDAERLYRQTLTINPRHADSLHLLGVAAHESGRDGVAVELIGKAITINGTEATYHCNLGTALWKQGRLDLALSCYRRALALRPDYAKAHFNLGTVLWKQGSLNAARESLRAALQVSPSYPEALDNLGTVLMELGQLDDAVDCYGAAIGQRPDYPEAHNNLGTVLLRLGRAEEAAECYRAAIALRPNYPEASFNLGNAVWDLGRPGEAEADYRSAIALKPDYADAWLNLGTVLKEMGRLDEGTACYRKVLALEPEHPEAHCNLGIALLAQGNLEEGWREHEWRWRTPQMARAYRDFARPQWCGDHGDGRTLLIHAEQGYGDTLQFCRYATEAAKLGWRVVMEAQTPLVRLLRHAEGIDRVVAFGDHPGDFDVHCPMLSLPFALRTTLETIPAAAKYLQADPAQTAQWSMRLAQLTGPRIGLVWAGNPREHSRALAAVDRRRSMTPERLAPLFAIPGVHFVSLQKTGPAAPAALPLADFMGDMHDFADTAALIENLDLVISVDTAVAHLAAALGKPVWLLDRFDSCWRWLIGRRDSPWYPSLRLYRQPEPGDWDTVLTEMARDLYLVVCGSAI